MSRPWHAFAAAVAFSLSLLWSRRVAASGEFTYWGSYDVRVPVGNVRTFVGAVSWQGVVFETTYSISDAIAVGAAFDYNMFQENFPPQTIAIPNGAITAPSTRYIAAWTVSPTVNYFPLRSEPLHPYLSIAAGPLSVVHATLASDITLRDSDISLFVQPSMGTFLRLSGPAHLYRERDSGAGLIASISWAFTTATFKNVDFVSYVGAQVGLFAQY